MYSNQKTFVEKRDFIRMSVDCSLSYRAVGSADYRMGRCVNLSAKGVLFHAGESIPVGCELHIKVDPEVKISPPLLATAEVVRVEAAEGPDGYRVAARITEVR